MGLESVNTFVQIIAGLAVVGSLLYVGVQIHQNTRAAKLAAVQSVQSAIGQLETLIVEGHGFAEILKSGITGADLPATDKIRLNAFYRHTLRTWQSAYFQYTNKALPESVWQPQLKSISAILHADKGLRLHFETEKDMLESSFVSYLDAQLKSTHGAQLSGLEDIETNSGRR